MGSALLPFTFLAESPVRLLDPTGNLKDSRTAYPYRIEL